MKDGILDWTEYWILNSEYYGTLDSSVQDYCDSCYGQGPDHQVATTQTHLKPLEAELIMNQIEYQNLPQTSTQIERPNWNFCWVFVKTIELQNSKHFPFGSLHNSQNVPLD